MLLESKFKLDVIAFLFMVILIFQLLSILVPITVGSSNVWSHSMFVETESFGELIYSEPNFELLPGFSLEIEPLSKAVRVGIFPHI